MDVWDGYKLGGGGEDGLNGYAQHDDFLLRMLAFLDCCCFGGHCASVFQPGTHFGNEFWNTWTGCYVRLCYRWSRDRR